MNAFDRIISSLRRLLGVAVEQPGPTAEPHAPAAPDQAEPPLRAKAVAAAETPVAPPIEIPSADEAPTAADEAPIVASDAPTAAVEAQTAADVASADRGREVDWADTELEAPELFTTVRPPVTTESETTEAPVREEPAAVDEPEPAVARSDAAEVEAQADAAVATAEPDIDLSTEAAVEAAPAGTGVAGLVLRLENERMGGKTFEVARGGATIGRGQENGIHLEDISVSRKHAKIVYKQGGYWLSDLGSMGGTWLDGTKLNAPRRVAPGQVIDIGMCRLKILSIAEPAPDRRASRRN